MASKLQGLSNGRVSSHDLTVGRDTFREAMRLKLKVLKEQEKRQCSIILRVFNTDEDLQATSGDGTGKNLQVGLAPTKLLEGEL